MPPLGKFEVGHIPCKTSVSSTVFMLCPSLRHRSPDHIHTTRMSPSLIHSFSSAEHTFLQSLSTLFLLLHPKLLEIQSNWFDTHPFRNISLGDKTLKGGAAISIGTQPEALAFRVHMSVAGADLDNHSNLFYLTLFGQFKDTYTLAITACGSNGLLTEYFSQAEVLFNEDDFSIGSAATNASALHSAIEWHQFNQTIPSISGTRIPSRSIRRIHPEQQKHIMNSNLRQVLINSLH